MQHTENDSEQEDKKAQEAGDDNISELNQEVNSGKDESEKEEVDYKDKYFYIAAEMVNQTKRLEREKSQIIKFSSERVLKDLISVVDTFELTLNALRLDQDEKMKNVVVGLDMVRDQFLAVLKSNGLEVIETKDKKFDPNFHEAIAQENRDDKEEMDIITEHQSGYILNGRVLRASKVVVASKE
jgi:molecular chaperone GrpE